MMLAPQPVVPLCTKAKVVAPKTWILACADANFWFGDLRWQHWGAAKTAAVGTAHANDCTPNCAAGHFRTHVATVTLAGSRTCNGRRQYAKLVVSYPGKRSPVFSPFSESLGCTYP